MRVLKQIIDAGDAGRDRLRADRHARDPALAGIPRGLRPADAGQHERASSRRAALPVRRSRGDHHADAQGSAHGFDAYATASPSRRCGFPSGVLAVSLEDVWSGPREEGYADDQHIHWRVDGTLGVAKGTIGWPTGAASTLTYASTKATGGQWVTPTWETMWFPHAFIGVMEQLQHAVATGTAPALSVADNVKTMALVEAGYRSIGGGRGRSALRDRDRLKKHENREEAHHDASRNFHGIFPLRPRGDGAEDPRARVQHGAARPAFQGRRPVGRADHRGQGEAGARRRSATTICRSAASRATPTSSIRTRRSAEGGSAISRRSSATPGISARPT